MNKELLNEYNSQVAQYKETGYYGDHSEHWDTLPNGQPGHVDSV